MKYSDYPFKVCCDAVWYVNAIRMRINLEEYLVTFLVETQTAQRTIKSPVISLKTHLIKR